MDSILTVKQTSIRRNLLPVSLSIDMQNMKQEERKKKECTGVLAEMIVAIADAGSAWSCSGGSQEQTEVEACVRHVLGHLGPQPSVTGSGC